MYFPQNNTSLWDTISPSSLNWCQDKIDSLYNFLELNNTKSFILLGYDQYYDIADGTGIIPIWHDIGNDNDQNASCELWIGNPIASCR